MRLAPWLVVLLAVPGSAQTELSGKLEVIVEMPTMAGAMGPASAGAGGHMHFMGPSKLHYRLKLDDGRYVMLQGAGLDPAALKTGARVRVQAQAALGAAALASAPAAAPRSPVDFPAVSVQGLAVVSPAPEPSASRIGVAAVSAAAPVVKTLHLIHAIPDGGETFPAQDLPDSEFEQFFKQVSYGKLDVKVREYWVHDTAADAQQCTMGIGGSTDMPADAESSDYVMYLKGCAGACFAFVGGNSSVCGAPSIHEFGHNLGFQHANQLYCKGANGQPVSLADLSKDPTACGSVTYGDPNDVMGNGEGLDLIHRQGWLSASELPTVSTDGTFTIGGLDDAAATLKGLRLTAPAGARSAGAIFAQYLPGRGLGLRLNAIMGSYNLGVGDSQLLYAIRTPQNPWQSPQDPYWQAGDRFDDPVSGLHLAVLSESPTSATLQVHYGAGPATPPVDKTPPVVSIVSAGASGSGAGTVRVLVQASDDVGVTKVELYDGAALLQSKAP